MNPKELCCVNCGKTYPIGIYYYCDDCGFPLKVVYNDDDYPNELIEHNEIGIWKYKDFLPLKTGNQMISLGEGSTPLIRANRINKSLGLDHLYFKYEGVNPTGSFKDRPTSAGLNMAISLGVNTVVVSSTGNAGASLSAYAARAGLRALVFVTKDTPPSKLKQIHFHGAIVIPIKGNLSDAYKFALESSINWKWMNLTSTFVSPYTTEGNKTVAYELFNDLKNVPDYVIVPVSVGPLAVGIYQGFKDLLKIGVVNKLPKLVAAQTARCAPIARAFAESKKFVHAWEKPEKTIAGGIADPLQGYENDGTYALRVIRESNGCAISASEDKIIHATEQLATFEGIFSEPTGAVSIAVLDELKNSINIKRNEIVVCMITGHGLKQQTKEAENFTLPQAISPNLDELEDFLSKQVS